MLSSIEIHLKNEVSILIRIGRCAVVTSSSNISMTWQIKICFLVTQKSTLGSGFSLKPLLSLWGFGNIVCSVFWHHHLSQALLYDHIFGERFLNASFWKWHASPLPVGHYTELVTQPCLTPRGWSRTRKCDPLTHQTEVINCKSLSHQS